MRQNDRIEIFPIILLLIGTVILVYSIIHEIIKLTK